MLKKSYLQFLLAFFICNIIISGARADDAKITIVARVCPNYSDVMANRARNNIMESLEDLGPDSNYSDGETVSIEDEENIATQRDNCQPLNDWFFTLGDRISGSKDRGPYGELSKVGTATRTLSGTKDNVNVRDSNGQPNGDKIDGAVTVTLNATEKRLLEQRKLTVQGGTPGDPLNASSVLGFATLRCGVDNKNADNVEYAYFPSGAEHIFCYAYYINPAPLAGKITITKRVENGDPALVDTFNFGGNVSFNEGGKFTLKAAASIEFDRAARDAGDPPWSVFEDLSLIPQGYVFRQVTCSTSGSGGSTYLISGAKVDINLKSGDTVTCEYVNRYSVSTVKVSPILECTARSAQNAYTGHFGYNNPQSSVVLVGPGTNNRFSPTPENRGQPYAFSPGRRQRVFAVDHNGSNLVWQLTGKTATSSSASIQRCHPFCVVPEQEEVAQCDPSIVINGSLSGTLNNNGQLTSYKWETDCPGSLINTETLRPILLIDYKQVGSKPENCSVELTVVDDTRYGSSGSAEISSKSCATAVTIKPCSVDCAGIPNGNTQLDECGVCGGDNSSCSDCAGIPNGGAVIDACGICGGDGSSCSAACSGDFDSCGVCVGNNSTCVDCSGIPNGLSVFDICGLCGGNGSTCAECVSSNSSAESDSKELKTLSKDLKLLIKNTSRYAKEAIACNPKKRSEINARIAAIKAIANDISANLDFQISNLPTVTCNNESCVEVSLGGVKAETAQLATSLRSLSRYSQLIVATCRDEIKSSRKERNSKELLEDILKQLSEIDSTVSICASLS